MLKKNKDMGRTHLDILNAIPGIKHAFQMSSKAAIFTSMKEEDKGQEEKYKELMLKFAEKVSEIWELSPIMYQYLVQRWVELKDVEPIEGIYEFNLGGKTITFKDVPTKQSNDNPNIDIEIMLANDDDIPGLDDINKKLEKLYTKLIKANGIRKGHIYLDVTFMDYKKLVNAYKSINESRKLLGMDINEIKAGAIESMDYTRALICAICEERGFSRKEIAELLYFKIYTQDIKSGTYPLVHKYLKVGREILVKLRKLDEYIHELTGMEKEMV